MIQRLSPQEQRGCNETKILFFHYKPTSGITSAEGQAAPQRSAEDESVRGTYTNFNVTGAVKDVHVVPSLCWLICEQMKTYLLKKNIKFVGVLAQWLVPSPGRTDKPISNAACCTL